MGLWIRIRKCGDTVSVGSHARALQRNDRRSHQARANIADRGGAVFDQNPLGRVLEQSIGREASGNAGQPAGDIGHDQTDGLAELFLSHGTRLWRPAGSETLDQD